MLLFLVIFHSASFIEALNWMSFNVIQTEKKQLISSWAFKDYYKHSTLEFNIRKHFSRMARLTLFCSPELAAAVWGGPGHRRGSWERRRLWGQQHGAGAEPAFCVLGQRQRGGSSSGGWIWDTEKAPHRSPHVNPEQKPVWLFWGTTGSHRVLQHPWVQL